MCFPEHGSGFDAQDACAGGVDEGAFAVRVDAVDPLAGGFDQQTVVVGQAVALVPRSLARTLRPGGSAVGEATSDSARARLSRRLNVAGALPDADSF